MTIDTKPCNGEIISATPMYMRANTGGDYLLPTQERLGDFFAEQVLEDSFRACCVVPEKLTDKVTKLLEQLSESNRVQDGHIAEVQDLTTRAIEQKHGEIATLMADTWQRIKSNDVRLRVEGMTLVVGADYEVHQDTEGFAGLSSGDRAQGERDAAAYQETLIAEGQGIDRTQRLIGELRDSMVLLAANQEADDTAQQCLRVTERAVSRAKTKLEALNTIPSELRGMDTHEVVPQDAEMCDTHDEVAVLDERDVDAITAGRRHLAMQLADMIATLRYEGVIADDGTKSEKTNTDMARREEYEKSLPPELCEFWGMCKIYDLSGGRKQFEDPSVAEHFADTFYKVLEIRRNRLVGLRTKSMADYKQALASTNANLRAHVEARTNATTELIETKTAENLTAAQMFADKQMQHYRVVRAGLEEQIETLAWYGQTCVDNMRHHQAEISAQKAVLTEAGVTFVEAATYLITSEPHVGKIASELEIALSRVRQVQELVKQHSQETGSSGSDIAVWMSQLTDWQDLRDSLLCKQADLGRYRSLAMTHRVKSFRSAIDSYEFYCGEHPVTLPNDAHDVAGFIETSSVARQAYIEERGRQEGTLHGKLYDRVSRPKRPNLPKIIAALVRKGEHAA